MERGRVVRLVALSAAMCLAAVGAVGCGRSGEPAEESASSTVTIDDSPITGTVNVWIADGVNDGMQPLFEELRSQNPDATINVTSVPATEIDSKVKNAIAGNAVPDLIIIGDVAPLIVTGGIQEVPNGVMDTSKMYENALKRGQDSTGKQYAVPNHLEDKVLIYHKKIADEAGVQAPTTWDEAINFYQALQKVDGVNYGIGMPVGHDATAYQMIISFLTQDGGSLYNEAGDNWNFNSDEMIEALTYYKKYFDLGISASGYSDDPYTPFIAGSTASTLQGIWLAPTLDGYLKERGVDNWSEDNLAAVVQPSGSANNASYLGGMNWVVPTDASNSEGAWKTARWMTQVDQQLKFYEASGSLPANTDAWNDPVFSDNAWAKVAVEQLDNTIADPAVPSWTEVSTIIDDESEKMVKSGQSPEQTAANIQSQAESIGFGW